LERIDVVSLIKKYSKKYKFPLIVLGLGLVFLLLSPSAKVDEDFESLSDVQVNILSVEDQLARILSSVKGAGKVQVMLTVAQGERIMYQTDEDLASGDSGTSRWDTVIITGTDRAQSGLIQQVIPPVYRGAIIVCQGAQNASVRLAIVEAVSNITGLGADKISVVKMK
jgi:stage III sporulation protein AG